MSVLPPTKAQSSTVGVPFGSARSSIITDDLVWEVLVRLPTKSLMRFKCVSKLWYLIIRNPKFAKSHGGSVGGGFRGLLISSRRSAIFPQFQVTRLFFNAKLNDCPRLMDPHLTIEECIYSSVTHVVRGLIGSYNIHISKFTLYNIATHEFIILPSSPSPPTDSVKPYSVFYEYFLGFNPVDEVYKVLSSVRLPYDQDGVFGGQLTHVFTLGINNSDMNCRNIAALPLGLGSSGNCINGALYWLGGYQNLLAFHLNNETYESIPIPESIKPFDIVEICESPALVVYPNNYDDQIMDVWTMKNHCRGDELEAWTRMRVILPYFGSASLNYAGIRLIHCSTLPTGEMMLAEHKIDNFSVQIYIYDHLKNKLDLLPIEGCEPSTCEEISGLENLVITRMHYYEENIISLDCLMSN